MGKRTIPIALFAICLVLFGEEPSIAQERDGGLGRPSLLQQQLAQSGPVRQAKLMKVEFRAFDCVRRMPSPEAQATRSGLKTFCQKMSKAGVFAGLVIPFGIISFAKTRKNPAYNSRAVVPMIRKVGFPRLSLSFGERFNNQ